MSAVNPAHVATWSIAAIAVLGVVTRPRNWPEAWWAVSGAIALVLCSLISLSEALTAIQKGSDVYLFLIGMMVLAQLARREGLFDWLAFYALKHAKGSASRLFLQIYAVGALVTIFLSNDATAVVLTPAVYAAARQAKAPPLPYLLICAFIANAASFVLPISNPANLIVFGDKMPALESWLAEFGAASVVAIISTYLLLRFTQRNRLLGRVAEAASQPTLPLEGRIAAGAIALTAVALLVASMRGWRLGLPTCACGLTAWLVIAVLKRDSPWPVVGKISWSILPLVAGLFVLVQGVESTGVLAPLIHGASAQAHRVPQLTALVVGSLVAIGSNLMNNLPMGLLAATVANGAQLPAQIRGALLIGVDLGPNLSVTGSLATILWLVAIRREGEDVGAGQFLAVGSFVMPLALLASLASFIAFGTLWTRS
jgi:arsenical pump membrane protein